MKTKTFSAMAPENLDRKINEYISNNNIKVIDIKFGVSVLELSALIMYHEK